MRFAVRDHGVVLSTRPGGQRALRALLDRATTTEHVTIDFGGVESVSYSFADELVGALNDMALQGQVPFTYSVSHAAPVVQRRIDSSLDRRSRVLSPHR